jgi:hypothetical protein
MNGSSYDTYEQEFNNLCQGINKKIATMKSSSINTIEIDQKTYASQIQRELEEADEIVLFG